MKRFERNEQFFGASGQAILRDAAVAVVGLGGLGSHVAQQLALLGVGQMLLIDSDNIEESNLNRIAGAGPNDVGRLKVDVGARLAQEIGDCRVHTAAEPVASPRCLRRLAGVDVVFGCVDNDGARLAMNEICAAYAKPYLDLATDIHPDGAWRFGGRIFINWDGGACLACTGLLDLQEVREAMEGPQQRMDRQAIYGIGRDALSGGGPSVVSINGVVASLAVTEFLVGLVGLRAPRRHLVYHGHLGKVTEAQVEPESDCYYCVGVRSDPSRSLLAATLVVPERKAV